MTKTSIDDWLFFAKSDLKLAKKALEEGIYHLACFHAQQAAEDAVDKQIVSERLHSAKKTDMVISE